MKIGITLTSSLEVGQEYIELTALVASSLAEQGMGIVYGGTAYGMMLTLAESYKEAGGVSLTGVMAKDLMRVTKDYVAYTQLDTTFLEETMEDRKRRIIEQSDAFLILPGGYGTLEEIGSIIGGRVNKLFDKPIAFYNHQHFYDTFFEFLDEIYSKRFSRISAQEFVYKANTLADILNYFQQYQKQELVDKFGERPII